MGTEEIDKHVFRKYEVHTKLGKGVSGTSTLMGHAGRLETPKEGPTLIRELSTAKRVAAWRWSYPVQLRVLVWALDHQSARPVTIEPARTSRAAVTFSILKPWRR